MTETPEIPQQPIELSHYRDTNTVDQEVDNIFINLNENSELDPKEVADTLNNAKDLSMNSFNGIITSLRLLRHVNSPERNNFSATTDALDRLTVLLLQDDQIDLAKSLISSSPHELTILTRSIEKNIPVQEQQNLTAKIAEIHNEKQTIFRETLSAQGVDTETQTSILTRAGDPDTALEISEVFWQTLPSFPHGIENYLYEATDVKKTAKRLLTIYRHGLIAYVDDTMLSRLETITSEQQAYLTTLKEAETVIPP
ncbi:MAG: hypothetical protein ACR2LN_05860 [Candidatus Levyibacteriota bacterium]